jgi:hypothetical protein
MKDGMKTVTTERWGGGKGEPGVPPTWYQLLMVLQMQRLSPR